MNIREFNESFKKHYQAQLLQESLTEGNEKEDLRNFLTQAVNDLTASRETNIKAYEIALQQVLENNFPDKAWWEVCSLNIFWHLFTERDPLLTVDAIMDNLVELDDQVDGSTGEPLQFTEGVKAKLIEGIKRILSKLNEDKMSPEDEADSALLRGIMDKMSKRSNARLTPEEQEVIKKYNLARVTDSRMLYPRDESGKPIYDRPLKTDVDGTRDSSYDYETGARKYARNGDTSKINYADRARKAPGRAASVDFGPEGSGRISTQQLNRHGVGRRGYVSAKSFNQAQDAHISSKMRKPMSDMKTYLWDRKYHSNKVDRAQGVYDADVAQAQAEYDRAMDAAKSRRDSTLTYNTRGRDSAQAGIDRLLKRSKPVTEGLQKYYEVGYNSNGSPSTVMVRASSEDEAIKVYNSIKGIKFPEVYGVKEISSSTADTNRRRGMSCLN